MPRRRQHGRHVGLSGWGNPRARIRIRRLPRSVFDRRARLRRRWRRGELGLIARGPIRCVRRGKRDHERQRGEQLFQGGFHKRTRSENQIASEPLIILGANMVSSRKSGRAGGRQPVHRASAPGERPPERAGPGMARKAQAPSVNRKFHGFAPDSFLHPAARLLRAAETARCPAWTRSLTHLTRMIGQLAQPMIHKLRSPIRVVCPTLVVYPGRSVRFPSLQLPRNGQIAAEAPIRRSFFKPPTSDQS